MRQQRATQLTVDVAVERSSWRTSTCKSLTSGWFAEFRHFIVWSRWPGHGQWIWTLASDGPVPVNTCYDKHNDVQTRILVPASTSYIVDHDSLTEFWTLVPLPVLIVIESIDLSSGCSWRCVSIKRLLEFGSEGYKRILKRKGYVENSARTENTTIIIID